MNESLMRIPEIHEIIEMGERRKRLSALLERPKKITKGDRPNTRRGVTTTYCGECQMNEHQKDCPCDGCRLLGAMHQGLVNARTQGNRVLWYSFHPDTFEKVRLFLHPAKLPYGTSRLGPMAPHPSRVVATFEGLYVFTDPDNSPLDRAVLATEPEDPDAPLVVDAPEKETKPCHHC